IQDSGANCSHQFSNRGRFNLFFSGQTAACQRHCETGPGNGSSSGSAISLQDVAIYPHCARPKFFQIDNGAQRSSDQSLNLGTTTVESPFGDIALLSSVG